MKKIIGLAMLASAAAAGAASAETTASVSLTTDYVFRGITQSDGGAAIQGSFDWSSDQFYAGVWGSSVNFGATAPTETASMELDLYAGWTPTTGPVTWDVGVVGYFYPNGDDQLTGGGEMDYFKASSARKSKSPRNGRLAAKSRTRRNSSVRRATPSITKSTAPTRSAMRSKSRARTATKMSTLPAITTRGISAPPTPFTASRSTCAITTPTFRASTRSST